jgi:hypothetical protein
MKTISAPSTKFPGWTGHTDIHLRADGTEVRRSYWMTHATYRFAIGIYRSADGGYSAELLTKQQGNWEPARNEFSGSVAAVVAEAERRGAYWEKQHKEKAWA